MDKQDKKILRILQENCKISSKDIAKRIGSKTSTVYAKIQKMEKESIIKGYHAVLDPKKMHRGVCGILHISVSYHEPSTRKVLSQHAIAKKIASFPEVQEVHIVSGEWDIIAKVRDVSVEEIGRFIIDKLRKVEGIEKVETAMVFLTEKETLNLSI